MGVNGEVPTPRLTCNAWRCGHVAKDPREYADHLAAHLNERVLQWSCRCGTFGKGQALPPYHHQPDGKPCWEGVVA